MKQVQLSDYLSSEKEPLSAKYSKQRGYFYMTRLCGKSLLKFSISMQLSQVPTNAGLKRP